MLPGTRSVQRHHACRSPTLAVWAIWTLLVLSAPDTLVNRDVSLSQQPPWGQAAGRRPQQMDPSVPPKLHPPLSTQWNPPRTSGPVVSVSARVCVCASGRHVLAGSHLSTMRIGRRRTSNNVGGHNRWYLIYLWNCIVIALHIAIQICVKQPF